MVRTVLSNQIFGGDEMFSFQANFKENTFHIWFLNFYELSKPTEQSKTNIFLFSYSSYMCLFALIDIVPKFKNKISIIVSLFLIQKIIDSWWFTSDLQNRFPCVCTCPLIHFNYSDQCFFDIFESRRSGKPPFTFMCNVLQIVFCPFVPFLFGHCVVCSSSIYGFWLPLWYLQTLLNLHLNEGIYVE